MRPDDREPGLPARGPHRSSTFRSTANAQEVVSTAILLAVLLLSAALIWYDLGDREVLGRDENVTIIHLDQPGPGAVLDTIDLKFTGQQGNMQPLYFLVQHLFWPLVGHSAFVLRFLPSVWGILAVALTYKLGAALFGRQAGLAGALLTALLPLHIRYAQIARPYSMLAALLLASAWFLAVALRCGRARHWVGFAVAGALAFYTHFNALFGLAAGAAVAAVAWLGTLVAALRGRATRRQVLLPVAAFLLLAILCLPAVLHLAGLPWAGLNADGEATGQVTVELTRPFFRGFLFRSGIMDGWQQALIAGLALVGLVDAALRRRWQAALLAGLWVALPFVVLAVARSPRPFEERYVIFVPPLLLLLAGAGVAALARLVGRLAPGRRRERVRAGAALLLLAVLVLFSLQPLRVSYAYNRSSTRLDEFLAVVEQHAGPGETIVVSPRFVVRDLHPAGARVVYLAGHPSAADVEHLARDCDRLWVLYTSYLPPVELQEPLDQWLQAHSGQFVRIPIKAVTALAFGSLVPADLEASLQGQSAVLEDLAALSVSKYEAWQRHSALADAYQALSDLYAGQGQAARAEEYGRKADAARAAAPPP